MNKQPKSPKSSKRTGKSAKPFHVEIHGDGIDIVATIQGNDGRGESDKPSKKTKGFAWDKLFQIFEAKIGAQPVGAVNATSADISIGDVVDIISSAPEEDLNIIHAAFRARIAYDTKDAAAKDAASAAQEDAARAS